MKVLVDQHGGVISWIATTPGDDRQLVVGQEQDVTRLLEANRRDRDIEQNGEHYRLAARIPRTVVNQALREGWFNDRAKWRAWLNDPDNRMFRIWPGRV